MVYNLVNENAFLSLKYQAMKSRVKGCFLLSIGEMSDFWIDINEFNNPSSIEALTKVTSFLLKKVFNKCGKINVIIPYYNLSSEKIFPLKSIVEKAVLDSKLNINVVSMYVDSEKNVRCIEGSIEGELCVLFMAVSVHIYSMLDIIHALQMSKKRIVVFSFLCRELFSLEILKREGVALIPYLWCHDSTSEVVTLPELLKNSELSSIFCTNLSPVSFCDFDELEDELLS